MTMASSYPLVNKDVRHNSTRNTLQRPKIHSIQTVIPTTPTVQTLQSHDHERICSTTDNRQPVTVKFQDRQPGSGSNFHPHAPPQNNIKLAPTIEGSEDLRTIQHCAPPSPPLKHTHSAPIPIPTRPKSLSRPSTPLTARAEEGNYFPSNYYITPQKSHFPRSVRGGHPFQNESPTKVVQNSPPVAQLYSPARSSNMHSSQESPMYTPTSPLSPIMHASPVPSAHHARANARRAPPAANLRLSSLPRFHPANFSSKDSPSFSSPRTSSRPSHSQYPHRPYSEAQVKLQQYQRELVANATRSSRAVSSFSDGVKPSPPRLHPLGSPGPVTPMMLEGHGDYLIAGAGGSNGQISSVRDGREMVEQMIKQENERRKFPGREERISPAVSPAGGRG